LILLMTLAHPGPEFGGNVVNAEREPRTGIRASAGFRKSGS